MSLRLSVYGKVKPRGGAEAKASVNSALKSYAEDPKLGDLAMSRLKLQ